MSELVDVKKKIFVGKLNIYICSRFGFNDEVRSKNYEVRNRRLKGKSGENPVLSP